MTEKIQVRDDPDIADIAWPIIGVVTTTAMLAVISSLSQVYAQATGVQTTRFVDLGGTTLLPRDWLTVLSLSEKGRLEELLIRSPSSNFVVSLNIDGASILEKNFVQLEEIGQNSPNISAYSELNMSGETTGFYVVSIRNIPFFTSLLVKIQNTGTSPITFSQLFAKYIR